MPQTISVRVPATSANLGCAFDCAALALNLYLDIHVTPRKDGEITVCYSGPHPERIPADASNLVARTILETLTDWGKSRAFDLEIENQIPVGVGLGSSAAAIVGAITAAHWIADTTLLDEDLISRATRREGHPDNVAAAWHGGFTVSVTHDGRVFSTSCPVPESLQFALVIPDFALPTEKAREVLPADYSRADAIHNLQRATMLAAHFFSGHGEFQRTFFEDRFHQPYRTSLIPGLADVLAFEHPDVWGVCLSGAGPSVLAIVRAHAENIGEALREIFAQHGVTAEARVLAADNLGAKGWSLPG